MLENISFKRKVGISEFTIALFLLSTISFFINIPDYIYKFIVYFFYVILLLIAFRHNNSITEGKFPCVFFLLCVCLSIIPAKIYWGQPITVSIIAILPFVLYSLYLVLCRIKPDKHKLVYIIIVIARIFIVLSVLKLLFPFIPVGSVIEDYSRGDRILIAGDFFNMFYFFYLLDDFVSNKDKNKKTIMWLSLSLFCIILPLTRQRIFIALLLGGVMFIKKMRHCWMWVCLPVLLISLFIFLKSDNSLVVQTQEQLDSTDPYAHIRELGMLYYITEFPQKGYNTIIGNGIPSYSRSQYGQDSQLFAEETKIYLIDIGMTAIYNYFGLVGLFMWIWSILYFVFKKRYENEYGYCKYMLMCVFINSILSGVPLIMSQFIFIGICSYLLTPAQRRIPTFKRRIQNEAYGC